MVQIYFLEYQDVANITHRLEIDAPDTFLGDELVTNGNFGTDTDWTKETGWTISDGVAEVVTSNDFIIQDTFTYLSGRTYEVTYDLIEITQGACNIHFVGASTTKLTDRTEEGTFTEQITLPNDKAELKVGNGVTGSSFIIDNLSVKEVISQAATQEITGNVIQQYSSAKENLTPIRGSGLSIRLDADVSLTFEDLYSDEERTYSVTYFRDGIVTFQGWIDPDGLFQDYVRDRWLITLQCVDGLGFLNHLSFVNPLTFLPITGKQTELDILAVCLKRTSVLQNINTSIGIVYDGLSESLNVLENTFINANRFIKEDNNTIMSCKEVLNDLLEPYGATIASINGEWYVYKANELYLDNDTVEFFRYDSEGVALSPPTKTVDLSETLGSQIDGFFPHHCNADQTMDINASIGAYRVEYKYGLLKSLIENPTLINIGGVIDDWNIIDALLVTLPASGEPTVDIISNNNSGTDVTVLESDKFSVGAGFESVIILNIKSYGTIHSPHWMRIEIVLTEDDAPNKNYYFGENGQWNYDSQQSIRVDNITATNRSSVLTTIEAAATPVDGEIFIRLLQPFKSGTPDVDFRIDAVSLQPKEIQGQTTPTGETHTIQRTSKPSSKIANTETVFNGDNPSDVFVGTIYKADETTPTETWHRIGFDMEDTDKPLLQIMAEEKIRMNAKPSRIFSGSIFGWFSYLSVFTINGVSGKFMFLEYTYNTKANIINAKFKEIQGDELNDMRYVYALTYDNIENPTIGN